MGRQHLALSVISGETILDLEADTEGIRDYWEQTLRKLVDVAGNL